MNESRRKIKEENGQTAIGKTENLHILVDSFLIISKQFLKKDI